MGFEVIDHEKDYDNASEHSDEETFEEEELQELNKKSESHSLEIHKSHDSHQNATNSKDYSHNISEKSQSNDHDTDLRLVKFGKSASSQCEEASDERQDKDEEDQPEFLNFDYDESDDEQKAPQKPQNEMKLQNAEESSIVANPIDESYDMASKSWLDAINDQYSYKKVEHNQFKDAKNDPGIDIFGNKSVDLEEYKEPPVKKLKDKIIVNNIEFENHSFIVPLDEDKKIEEDLSYRMENIQLNDKKRGDEFERKLIHAVSEPVFALKIQKLVGNEIPHQKGFALFTSKLKSSIFGLTEEEADQLMRIDETYSELSNQDVILAKPKSLVKKTWRVKNLGTRQWPRDTRIVSVTDDLYFEGPKINNFLHPGEMMDFSIKIFIPETVNGDNNIKEYILRLYCDEFKWFGEPIIATCQIDTNQYQDAQFNLDDINRKLPRVTDSHIIDNYAVAKELSDQGKESFIKVLNDLNRADLYKGI